MEQLKKVWGLVKVYFPDLWQYLVVIVIMIIAGICIL